MLVYWVPLLLAALNLFVDDKKANRVITFICFLYMAILSGLRDYTVGTDTFRYAELFTGTRTTDKSLEFVFLWLVSICSGVFDSYTPFLLIMSFLIYVPLYIVARREIPNSFKYFLILFVVSNNLYFIDSFNSIRQLVSTSFLLVSYYYIQKNRFLPFSIFFIIAFGFHNSALFYLPFILLSRIRITHKTAYFIISCSLLFSLMGTLFLTRDILFDILNSITLFGINRYSHYLLFSDYSMGFNLIGMTKLVIIPGIVCMFVYKHTDDVVFSRIYMWGIVFLSVLSPFIAISARASMGLTAAELIAVPLAISRTRKKSKDHLIFVGYMVVYIFLFAYSLVAEFSSPEELGPYSLFF